MSSSAVKNNKLVLYSEQLAVNRSRLTVYDNDFELRV